MKKWIPWLFSVLLVAGIGFTAPSLSGGGCSACLLRAGDTATGTLASSVASASNAIQFNINGSRLDLGSGSLDYLKSDGTSLYVGDGTGYLASGVPVTLSSVYVNNVPAVFTYGGGKLPAHAFTVTAIKFNVRTAGSGGSTNATFQTTDGTNTCNCTYACNHAVGSDRAVCANGAGTGCVYAASAALLYKFTGVGDCAATSADLEGNVDVEGNWQ